MCVCDLESCVLHHFKLIRLTLEKKEGTLVCAACNAVITVKHILIECADLLEVGKKYFF